MLLKKLLQRATDHIAQAKPPLLELFGTFLRYRYDHHADKKDIENSISAARRAADLTPDTYPSKPKRLGILGGSLETLCSHLRGISIVESAIVAFSQADELVSDNHPDKPNRLTDLGGAFHTRYVRL